MITLYVIVSNSILNRLISLEFISLASFDLMRREQQKSLQEKRKQILEKQEDVIKSDITILPNKFENSQTVENSNTSKIQSNDSSRSFQLQASAPRPLVPPGFGSNAMESKLYPSTLNTSHSVEVNVGFIQFSIVIYALYESI